jgi:fructose-1,6-bisphosphatase/inositol monophosphatase family enzyme
MAAGILMVEEAGGVCTDMAGGPHHLRSPHMLTDNGLLHDELISIFGAIRGGEVLHAMPAV